jgi:hypothetical protein
VLRACGVRLHGETHESGERRLHTGGGKAASHSYRDSDGEEDGLADAAA